LQEAATIELKSTLGLYAIEVLTAQVEEQAAQIQRVSAQLAAATPCDILATARFHM
jgi:hypothetical protein